MTALEARALPISKPMAIAAMLASAACWGSATVMTKGALGVFDPLVLLVIQLCASVLALWSGVIFTGTKLPALQPMATAGSTGLFEPGMAYLVGVPGLALTTAGNASVIAAIEPIFILLGAWLIFGTALSVYTLGAVALTVIGVALVSLANTADLEGGSLLGDGLILISTGFAGAYVLASSRLALSMSAVLLTALQQTVGLAFIAGIAAVALTLGWQSLPPIIPPSMLLLAIVSGLVQYALAFWFYVVGLKGVSPGLAGAFLATTPIFGVIGGVMVLGERVVPSQLVGMVIVIIALIALVKVDKASSAPESRHPD